MMSENPGRPFGEWRILAVVEPAANLAASREIVITERSVVGSFAYTDAEFEAAVALSAHHEFDWVSTYPLDSTDGVFVELAAGRSSAIKAQFTPGKKD